MVLVVSNIFVGSEVFVLTSLISSYVVTQGLSKVLIEVKFTYR